MYGGPINYDISVNEEKKACFSELNIEHSIYKDYVNILSKVTKEKKSLNYFITRNCPSTSKLINDFFKDSKLINDNYKNLV